MEKKRSRLKFVVFIFIISISIAGIFFLLKNITSAKCGDGTKDGECSAGKPYFCEDRKLIEKASLCRCPEGFSADEDSCSFPYKAEPKTITMDYIIRGENKSFDFIAYKKMSDHLSELPRQISYENQESISRVDFELKKINDKEERELLLPLVVQIQNLASDRTEQFRIAVSIVQKIPYANSEKSTNFLGKILVHSRYPYEILYDYTGVCEEKTELLAFLLKELGYGVVLFYYPFENHQALGVKCPGTYDYRNTGYCFVETTGSSIISDSEIEYTEIGKLISEPEVLFISDGDSLGYGLYEYKDAEEMIKIRRAKEKTGMLNFFQHRRLEKLTSKYQLEEVYNVG